MFVVLFPERFNRVGKIQVNVGSTVSWTGVLDCTKREQRHRQVRVIIPYPFAS